MLTAEGCRRRRAMLWAALPETPDWIFLHSPRNLAYFSGYYQSPFLYKSQNAGAMLLLGSDGSSLLIADNLLTSFAESAHVDQIESPVWYNGRNSAPRRDSVLIDAVIDAMSSRRGLRFAFDSAVPPRVIEAISDPFSEFHSPDVDACVQALMRSKHPDEIAVLARCMRAAEAGYAAAAANIKPGMTELQAFELVNSACIEQAGEQVSLYGDFASGPRTEQGGGGPTLRVIEKNDLFILDFSVVIQGYRCDLCNTFVVDGAKPTARQKELAGYCEEAMAAGESALRAGVAGSEVDAAVRAAFARRDVENHFPHHSGHGIGLGHPDPPYLVRESSDTLVAADVVTLEPGLYIKGVGGMRFERNYLVTGTGFEQMSRHFIGLEPLAPLIRPRNGF